MTQDGYPKLQTHGDDRLSPKDPIEPAGAARDALGELRVTYAQVLLALLLLGAVPARVQARQRQQRAGEAAPPRRRYAWHVGWPGPSGEAEAARSPRVVLRVTELDRIRSWLLYCETFGVVQRSC